MNDEIQVLLIKSLRGNNKAKEKLLNKLKPAILSAIKRYYNVCQEYDDLIQEGYELILKCMKEYDFDKNVHFLWFVKLRLKYYYLDKNKKQIGCVSLNSPVFSDNENIELIDIIADEKPNHEEIVIKNENIRKLCYGIKNLTQRQKDIILRYYFKNQPMKDIAREMGISYRTVVNLKTKGINKLKKII